MPAHSHSEIYLHITWRVKNNAQTLSAELRPKLYAFLCERAPRDKASVHAIGGTADHVHLAVTVPPTLTISRWIGELKGASAYHVNQTLLNRKGALEWQTGYGVVSFGARDLPRVAAYIANQGEIHFERAQRERAERYRGPLASNRP